MCGSLISHHITGDIESYLHLIDFTISSYKYQHAANSYFTMNNTELFFYLDQPLQHNESNMILVIICFDNLVYDVISAQLFCPGQSGGARTVTRSI